MRRCWSGGILYVRDRHRGYGCWRWDGRLPLLVLDFCLDVVDGVGGLHLKGDRLPGEGLDEDLHLLGVGGGVGM